MNRIDETFKKLRADNKKAFIPYVAAGDPDIKTTKKIVSVLAAAGADIVELGIPFSDPLADGPTIQKAIQRSLSAGCSVRKVLDMVKELRGKVGIPLVFMTYYNIIFNYGAGRFIKDAKACGADGVIVPDLPMEESGGLADIADKEDFYVIMLAAPTTPPARFRKIADRSRGFIYYVSLTGVTGARKALSAKLNSEVKELKKMTAKPVCVGFGISNPAQASGIASASDGVIVGSAIIKVIEKNLDDRSRMIAKVEAFAGSIARAIHGV
ncbi:MAG: tryptophan synthase subunit alpha [Candidatus Makaraimicrobium thalassicum]|nr:MAG: tryptophan synthase subunit alpha [Candidatus Omnitrophota bacterium]